MNGANLEEMERRWAAVNEGLTDTQREKVRLVLAAAQFANAAYIATYEEDARQALLTAKHFAVQYFTVVAELQRVAGTTSEQATVAHMEKISRLLVERGWHGLPSTAKTVHTDMTRFRAYVPETTAQEEVCL